MRAIWSKQWNCLQASERSGAELVLAKNAVPVLWAQVGERNNEMTLVIKQEAESFFPGIANEFSVVTHKDCLAFAKHCVDKAQQQTHKAWILMRCEDGEEDEPVMMYFGEKPTKEFKDRFKLVEVEYRLPQPPEAV